MTPPIFNLLLSATVVTILLSPLADSAAPALLRWLHARRPDLTSEIDATAPPKLAGHAIICGYGRVGSTVCALLERLGKPFIVSKKTCELDPGLRRNF